MSLSVQHLNADTTFLLSFSSGQEALRSPCRPFTVLVDPWLTGSSLIWTARFSISNHTCESVVSSLRDIPLPDVILISQDKTDHCHEQTLKTLPPDSPVKILAVPAAAKKIKSWKYFTRAIIKSLPVYNPRNPDSVIRIPVRPTNPAFGHPGEITISFVQQRMDMTGLHNALGITYLAPCTNSVASLTGETVQLPLSPPLTPIKMTSQVSAEKLSDSSSRTGPYSPTSHQSSFPKPLSVLYAPHGIGLPCLTPFMKHHLAPMNALPLTLLLHSIDIAQNPWYLGGMVAPGLPGGTQLVKAFGAKYWLSAHDEAKDNQGWAVAMLKSRRYTLEEAQILLDDDLEKVDELRKTSISMDGRARYRPGSTRLINLSPGEQLNMTAA
ncbi:hypothetical protein ANO11243_055250 [Dothideomycetidae sp. 11243]|nr:hypothetical protein ANO11243_055250 [fungal sp. No.11243]